MRKPAEPRRRRVVVADTGHDPLRRALRLALLRHEARDWKGEWYFRDKIEALILARTPSPARKEALAYLKRPPSRLGAPRNRARDCVLVSIFDALWRERERLPGKMRTRAAIIDSIADMLEQRLPLDFSEELPDRPGEGELDRATRMSQPSRGRPLPKISAKRLNAIIPPQKKRNRLK